MSSIKKFTVILFELPDKKVLLQRRTLDAKYSPYKLSMFGGWVEDGETPDENIIREIQEETSLDIKKLEIELLKDFILPKSGDFKEDRHFYLYTAKIPSLDFKVYEGHGAEPFTIDEVKARDDLSASVHYVFNRIL